MLPRNGFCLLFVALCITVGYANNSAQSINTFFDLEQGKFIDISSLQHKLEQTSATPSTKKPRRSRPTYRPYPPPPIYWPPYPPQHYPPPPHHPPPQHYPPDYPPTKWPRPPKPRPPRPPPTRPPPTRPPITHPPSTRPPTCPIRDRRDRLIQEYCEIPANRVFIVCSNICRDYGNVGFCLPICAADPELPVCSVDCIVTPRDPECILPPSAEVAPPAGCETATVFIPECFYYCQTYPNDETLTWCEIQRDNVPEVRSLGRSADPDPCANSDPSICANACRVDPSISWCPYNSRRVSGQSLSRYELSELFGRENFENEG